MCVGCGSAVHAGLAACAGCQCTQAPSVLSSYTARAASVPTARAFLSQGRPAVLSQQTPTDDTRRLLTGSRQCTLHVVTSPFTDLLLLEDHPQAVASSVPHLTPPPKSAQLFGLRACGIRDPAVLPRQWAPSCATVSLHVVHITDPLSLCRVPEECPQSVATIVSDCTDEDPDKRPSAREVVERLMRIREGPGGPPTSIQEGAEPLTEGLAEAAPAQHEAAARAEAGAGAGAPPAAAGGNSTDAAPGDQAPAAGAEADPGAPGPDEQGSVPFGSIWRAQLSQHHKPGGAPAPAGNRRSGSNSFTRHRRTMSLPAHDGVQPDQEAEQAPESQVPLPDATCGGAEPTVVTGSDEPTEPATASEHQAVPGSRSSQESVAPQSPHAPAEPQYQRPPRPAYMISPALMHNIPFAFPSAEPTVLNHSQESLDSHHESATGYH